MTKEFLPLSSYSTTSFDSVPQNVSSGIWLLQISNLQLSSAIFIIFSFTKFRNEKSFSTSYECSGEKKLKHKPIRGESFILPKPQNLTTNFSRNVLVALLG